MGKQTMRQNERFLKTVINLEHIQSYTQFQHALPRSPFNWAQQHQTSANTRYILTVLDKAPHYMLPNSCLKEI